MENENRKGNTVLLTVIATATLLVAVVGATFAYFTVAITGNESATSIIVKTATLGINYETGNTVIANDIMPGDTIPTKNFTVENTGDVNMNYDIEWVDVTNTFIDKTDLKYTVTSTATSGTAGATVGSVQAPSTNGTMLSDITIEAGAEHSYTLVLEFPNLSTDQNSNQGKSFSGKIHITTSAVQP